MTGGMWSFRGKACEHLGHTAGTKAHRLASECTGLFSGRGVLELIY